MENKKAEYNRKMQQHLKILILKYVILKLNEFTYYQHNLNGVFKKIHGNSARTVMTRCTLYFKVHNTII